MITVAQYKVRDLLYLMKYKNNKTYWYFCRYGPQYLIIQYLAIWIHLFNRVCHVFREYGHKYNHFYCFIWI